MTGIEDLYRKDESAEVDVLDVTFTVRILTGVEYLNIIQQTADARGVPNQSAYAKRLIEECVIEPKVDVDKLKPVPFILLLGRLEELHGATELIAKKLQMR